MNSSEPGQADRKAASKKGRWRVEKKLDWPKMQANYYAMSNWPKMLFT